MLPRFCASSAVSAARLGLAFLGLTALAVPSVTSAAPAPGFQALPGHIPAAVASSQQVSALGAEQTVSLALTLPLHHQAELTDLLRGLSDPKDPRFGQYLTPDEFAARFSPTPAEYARVMAYAKSVGLTVTNTHPNRTLLDVSGSTSQVERAFGLHLLVYQSQMDGRYFFAPDAEPQVPAALGGLVSGVVGLDNASLRRPHLIQKPVSELAPILDPYTAPLETGSGPGGGLTPTNIKAAYNLSGASQTGSGQTLGLFELDGYTASDITAYDSAFGLPSVPLQNVAVDGGVSTPGSGAAEVTLDIELQEALAPNASKILVYEAPNSDAGVVDTYNKIASDNLAKEISTSWGQPEADNALSTRNSENAAFQQMAAQGQSIYAASGDHGADDNGSSLSVDDPASQPYMVGVGGTALATNGAGGSYKSETTWNNSIGAGGGGVSTIWSIPSYQSGVVGSAASKGSATHRNVPDVSLDADPNTGYSIYYNGGWTLYGGTSCAAPLWAAFTALVNQKRAASGSSLLGFANPPIYAVAASGAYANDFHDIADGSTNQYYPAVTGYDDAIGWGTFNGANLLADLSGGSAPAVPAAPSGLSATPSNAQVALSWTGSTGASSYTVYRGTAAGTETPLKSGITVTSYTDTGSTNGTTYFYQVAAVSSGGTSARSNEASATPKAVQVRFVPRSGFESRMVGGVFQGSQDNSAWTTLAAVTHSPASGQYTALPTSADPASFRYLRYLAPNGAYGNIAELEFDSSGVKLTGTGFGTPGSYNNGGNDFTKALDGNSSTYFDAPYPGNADFVGIDRGVPAGSYTKLTGTGFGTSGSYDNSGNDFSKVFDGSFSTFFDAPYPGNADFAGLDLGAGNTAAVTRIGYAPRAGYESRMVGGVFQGSNDNATWTPLYTVTSAPPSGTLTETTAISSSASFRYLRYLAPNGAYGNIAELEFDASP